jgi:transcriptional regulator with XRE-family HTH domain
MKDDPEALAQRLRSERKRLKLTGAAMAQRLGVSERTLRSYESGERAPTVDYLTRADSLGVDVSYVMFGPRKSWRVTAEYADLNEIIGAFTSIEEACEARSVRLSTYKKGRLLALVYRRRVRSEAPTAAELEALVELAASEEGGGPQPQ